MGKFVYWLGVICLATPVYFVNKGFQKIVNYYSDTELQKRRWKWLEKNKGDK